MTDDWGDDGGFGDSFDEGFGRGPEGFSDFQEDWGAPGAFWESEGDGGGPDEIHVSVDDLFADADQAFDDQFADEVASIEAGTNDEWNEQQAYVEEQMEAYDDDKAAFDEIVAGQFDDTDSEPDRRDDQDDYREKKV